MRFREGVDGLPRDADLLPPEHHLGEEPIFHACGGRLQVDAEVLGRFPQPIGDARFLVANALDVGGATKVALRSTALTGT